MLKGVILGDIVSKSGVNIVTSFCKYKEALELDFIIVNAENSAGGFGINAKIIDRLIDSGIDIITLGNHISNNIQDLEYICNHPSVAVPSNIMDNNLAKEPIIKTINNHRICVINLLGTLFINRPAASSPFEYINSYLQSNNLKNNIDAIIVDFHAEATSEKIALGHMLDGLVSCVVGTHTHIPTNDTHITAMGTGYQTDLGMCGDYVSVIGMQVEGALSRFLEGPKIRLKPACKNATLSGCYVEIAANGLCNVCSPLIMGDTLSTSLPIENTKFKELLPIDLLKDI